MKKTKFTKKKFNLISTSDKKRIRGGYRENNDNDNGSVPPYQPGGQGDDDKDSLILDNLDNISSSII